MPHTSIPPYVKLKDPVISDLDIFSSVPFKWCIEDTRSSASFFIGT
jgi:hypothetical protein